VARAQGLCLRRAGRARQVLVGRGSSTPGSTRSTTAVDTDFAITLCHVLADGTVNTIQDGIIRARHRDGAGDAPDLVPGAVECYAIGMSATSYLVPAGDRLRIDVASTCFDRYDRNTDSGEPTGRGTRIVVAEQAVHHAAATPSHVVLPVIPAAA